MLHMVYVHKKVPPSLSQSGEREDEPEDECNVDGTYSCRVMVTKLVILLLILDKEIRTPQYSTNSKGNLPSTQS